MPAVGPVRTPAAAARLRDAALRPSAVSRSHPSADPAVDLSAELRFVGRCNQAVLLPADRRRTPDLVQSAQAIFDGWANGVARVRHQPVQKRPGKLGMRAFLARDRGVTGSSQTRAHSAATSALKSSSWQPSPRLSVASVTRASTLQSSPPTRSSGIGSTVYAIPPYPAASAKTLGDEPGLAAMRRSVMVFMVGPGGRTPVDAISVRNVRKRTSTFDAHHTFVLEPRHLVREPVGPVFYICQDIRYFRGTSHHRS